MKANGITMDLAPVLDLDDRPGPSDSNPDGTRSFTDAVIELMPQARTDVELFDGVWK